MAGVAGSALLAGTGIAQAQAAAWDDIAGPNGLYQLQLPKGFRYVAIPRQDGGTVRMYTLTTADKITFDFTFADFVGNEAHLPASPAELAARLVGIQAGMEKSWPGEVLEQAPIELGGTPGRRFLLSVEQGRAVVAARVYFGTKAIYSQTAYAPAAARQDPAIAQFMDSLRLAD